MKRCTVILLLFIAGCSHSQQFVNQEGSDASSVQKIELTVPKTIFHEHSKGLVSEKEANTAIQRYLDSDAKLTKQHDFVVAVSMPHNELSKDNKKRIREIILLTQQNDKNFKQYVESNQFPGEYQEEIKRISKYISGSNKYLNALCKKLENKNASIEIIESLSHVPSNVNNHEALKIVRFLKKKDIQTQLFIN